MAQDARVGRLSIDGAKSSLKGIRHFEPFFVLRTVNRPAIPARSAIWQ